MNTFQTIILSIVFSFTDFLPLGSAAHQVLIPYLLNWPEVPTALLGAFSLGAFLSVFIYFFHDWASLISSFIQVIIYRKKPMTLDERLPFFLIFTMIPYGIGFLCFHKLDEMPHPYLISLGLFLFILPLWLSDAYTRRQKSMFNWNWLDSMLVGLAQCLTLIPGVGLGCGRMTGALIAGLGRGHYRESAAKFAFLASAPILLFQSFFYLKGLSFQTLPTSNVTGLTFFMAITVTFATGLLAIGSMMKHFQQKSVGGYLFYRFIFGLGTASLIWLQSRGLGHL